MVRLPPKTGVRLKAEFGTAAFFVELAALERKLKREESLPGTLGRLFALYRASPTFADLAPSTRDGYIRMMSLLQPAANWLLSN